MDTGKGAMKMSRKRSVPTENWLLALIYGVWGVGRCEQMWLGSHIQYATCEKNVHFYITTTTTIATSIINAITTTIFSVIKIKIVIIIIIVLSSY